MTILTDEIDEIIETIETLTKQAELAFEICTLSGQKIESLLKKKEEKMQQLTYLDRRGT